MSKRTTRQTAGEAPQATPHAEASGPPPQGHIPPRAVRPGFTRSFCYYCSARGQDHDPAERECVLRRRARRATAHYPGRDGIRKGNIIFRRWLIWAYGKAHADKMLPARA